MLLCNDIFDLTGPSWEICMKRICFIILILCALIFSACDEKSSNNSSQKNGFISISAEKFKQKLRTNEYILIDVKTKKEHEKEKIFGSILVDFFKEDFESKLKRLDRKQKYLIYCHGGERSSLVLRLMNRLGFNEVYELKGGITSWKSAGFQVVKKVY